MAWTVLFHPAFVAEVTALRRTLRREMLAQVELLRTFGPDLRRPHADTLKGSKHRNMKELRFTADDGAWRVAFAFDPLRRAIVLVAGDKSGTSEKRFYRTLIAKADVRFDEHLRRLEDK